MKHNTPLWEIWSTDEAGRWYFLAVRYTVGASERTAEEYRNRWVLVGTRRKP